MATCVVVPFGPACVNLTGVRAGDRNEMTVSLASGGVPLDLTGKTVLAQARKKPTDPDPAAITADIVVLDALGGRLLLRWPGDQVTAALNGKAAWSGVWDMQVGNGSGDPTTVIGGTFGAEMDVAR